MKTATQLSLLLLFLFTSELYSQKAFEFTPKTSYQSYFEQAYQTYPAIPKGLLESIAYTNTRIEHIQPDSAPPSCMGLPKYYGVMGLVEDGKGYFKNNLITVAQLSGYSVEQIKTSPEINIMAFAKAYNSLLQQQKMANKSVVEQTDILHQLTEFPENDEVINNYAFDSHLYSVFTYLNHKDFQATYQTQKFNLDLEKAFGQNYKILSASHVKFGNEKVTANGSSYDLSLSKSAQMACNDLSPSVPFSVLFVAADASNYSSRNGTAITHITIHTVQGSYAGAISWFQNPISNVSAHYNIRASDGQVTQMVCEADKAWHVGINNPFSIGYEHEGYVDDPTWYTEATYYASSQISIDIINRYGIEPERCYDKNGDYGLISTSANCHKIKGHQHYPSQTHVDPGPNWDWNYYYDLINANNQPLTQYTACTGNFTDPGGTGNYGNDERQFYRISPTGASSVTAIFNTFNLEDTYDFLYVYDGDSWNDELIATLSGTTLPASITGNSGSLLFEFRTDCATTAAGWDISWTCSTATPACGVPTNLSVSNLSPNEVLLSWNAVSGASSYIVEYENSIDPGIITETTTNPSLEISGLAQDGNYTCWVTAVCSGNQSAKAGHYFVNTGYSASDYTNTNCEGVFTDDGGTIGNYKNYQNYTYTIAPTGATNLTLSFTVFELESSYDFMYIYDGLDATAPLIGTYSGTNSPGTINASNGALTIVFTSDSWTTEEGWVASWSCTNNGGGGNPVLANPIIQSNSTGDLNCGLSYHNFYDSGGSSGNYSNNETLIQTICNPNAGDAIRLNFRAITSGNPQLDLDATATGNDYLYIFDGPDTTYNQIGAYTGTSSSYPQPGSFISSGECLTVMFVSDGATNGSGWNGRAYCYSQPTNQGTINASSTNPQTFTDSGGTSGNYLNNENYTVTYCPDNTVTNGDVIWANFNNISGIEQNWDYLYVYDGQDMSAPLLGVFTGNSSNQNTITNIGATINNASGCLTFHFFSDGATVASGWNATITTALPRLANATDDCADATTINQFNTVYAGNNYNATGYPSNADPSLSLSVAGLAECSGSSSITRLENTIWYEFTTPANGCTNYETDIQIDNVSCHHPLNSGIGFQLALFEFNACQTGAAWGSPVYCNDFVQSGDLLDISGYLNPNTHYYIMVDGFAGQHCNFDLELVQTTSGGSPITATLSSNSPQCEGDNVTLTASPSSMANYHFFLDANNNGLIDAGESLQNGTLDTYTDNALNNTDIIGIEITDANGCTGLAFETVAVINCCVDSLVITPGMILNDSTQVQLNISTSGNVIINPSDVISLFANDFDLNEDFEVLPGGQLLIINDPCTP